MFQHNLVMATTASRAKYSGGGKPPGSFSRLQWKQLYSLRIYKDKGIATSRLYQQLSHRFLNFSESPPIWTNLILDQGVCLSKNVAFKSPIISSLFGSSGKDSDFLYTNLLVYLRALSLYPYHGFWEDLVGLLLWLC